MEGNFEQLSKNIREIILNIQEPLLVKNQLDWEILTWDLNKWKEILADNILTFRIGENRFTKEPQRENVTKEKNMTFSEFLDFSENNKKYWAYYDYKYLKKQLTQVDQLRKFQSLSLVKFGFPELTADDYTIWIGNKGAHTSCHKDTYGCNLIAQIYGRKEWLLFPPEENLMPTRVPYEESTIFSELNFFSPILNKFSGVGNCRRIILEPGDVLILPFHWWHYVENLDLSISINSWIPLPQDSTERLGESFVNLIVLQMSNLLTHHERKQILNPSYLNCNKWNEDNPDVDVEDREYQCTCGLDLKEPIDLIDYHQKLCKEQEKNKRLKREGSLKVVRNFGETLEESKCLNVVPILPADKFKMMIDERSRRFPDNDDDDDTYSLFDNENYKKYKNIIDAMTHEDVISLMCEKIKNK